MKQHDGQDLLHGCLLMMHCTQSVSYKTHVIFSDTFTYTVYIFFLIDELSQVI